MNTIRPVTKAQGTLTARWVRTYTTARISLTEWSLKPSAEARATYSEFEYWRGVENEARAALAKLGIHLA